MRRLASIAAMILAAGAAFAATAVGEDERTYYMEFDNAFGLVDGSEVKIAGVAQGTIEELFINEDKRAVVKVNLAGPLSRLGEDTICSSEPQSLIAEYFIDCEPKGSPLEPDEGSQDERIASPDIPVEQTRQTVQNDLVQSGLRQSYSERLRLIINEFGTALAGNPENLNAAIRRGAPALTSARKVTRILGDQNRIIKDLNVNSDTIMARLAARRKDVVSFIKNAKKTAQASVEVRDDLSANFRDLDDFLAELRPTMRRLRELAVVQTPLLSDLGDSAPGLARLSRNLPDFNSAATKSLKSLGEASVVGRSAVRKGTDEIKQLRQSTKNSASAADHLAKFLRDIDDPDRAVAVDARAAEDTGRSAPTGYTGLEGLLNYAYYQTGALSQFDQISHLLHFSIFEVAEGPCAEYNAEDHVPNRSGNGTTTNPNRINRCVAWLGENQPGINQDIRQDPYDPSVCPDGSADPEICDPAGGSSTAGRSSKSARTGEPAVGGADGAGPDTGSDGGPDSGADEGANDGGGGAGGGGAGGGIGDVVEGLDDIIGLDGRKNGLPKLPRRNGNRSAATGDLLGFLFND